MASASGGGEPLYVVKLDADAHKVVVGPKKALAVRRVPLKETNWIGEGAISDLPEEGIEVLVKVRSTRPPREAVLRPLPDGRAEVELALAEEGIAPGQACVFYATEGSRVLGGGWIATA